MVVSRESKLVKQILVLLRAESQVTENLAQQRPHDDLGAVVWDDYYAALSITKGIVACHTAHPSKSRGFRNLR